MPWKNPQSKQEQIRLSILRRYPSQLLLCVLLCPLAISGKLCFAQTAVPLKHAVVSTWTTDQGLPQNFISSLAQTPDGFIWVGTLTGLARFDGVSFRGFSKDGPAEMQDNICALFPDRENGLWICAANRLFHYRNGRFTSVQFADGRGYRIEAIGPASDGGVWIYAGGKLARTQRDRLQAVAYPANTSPAHSLAQTSDGTLWIADGAGVTSIQNGSQAIDRYPLADAQSLYAAQDGTLYVGDGHKLFRYDGRTFVEVENPGLTNFVSVMVDRENRLWMASGGLRGLSRKSGDTVERLTASDGLASNDVRTMLEDASGDVWIGTIAGLQRLHRGIFTTLVLPPSSGGQQPQIDAVFGQKNGAIWAGTVEDGAYRWLNGGWQQFGVAQGLPRGQIRGFFEDGAMPSVAISDYGIFAWNGKRYAKLPSIPHGYISTPAIAGDGSLWFHMVHGGVARLQNGHVQMINSNPGHDGDQALSVMVDPSGTPWAGTSSALERWTGAQFQTMFESPASVLSVEWVHGGMAIGTMHGLVLRSDSGTAHTLTQDDGLPGNTVLSLLKDSQEGLWIITTRAIARLPKQQWVDVMQGHTARVSPAIYTVTDGLKNNNVLPLNVVTAMRGSDGRVWIATPGGISALDPQLPKEASAQAIMDSVFVDEQQLPAANTTVQPGQHRITFRYTAPAGVAAAQTRFRYRLAGWDTHWIDAGAVREVSYTALRPGEYTFQVIAINREGQADSLPATIQLNLLPHFWQTTWFLTVAILCAAGVIVEVVRRRTHLLTERLTMRFEERVAERERIAYQIHDTLIQDLIGATLKLELVGFQIADRPRDAQHSVDELAGRMRDTIARGRHMVSSLHFTTVPQYDLVDVLQRAEAEFRMSDRPKFTLAHQGEPRPLHPLIRDEVYRICREALANAFRHSGAANVAVFVNFLPASLEVEIADDGHGMSEEIRLHGRPGHFGLRAMQAHALRIGATVAVASVPQGTTVRLRVKTRPIRKWWPGKLLSRKSIRTEPMERDGE